MRKFCLKALESIRSVGHQCINFVDPPVIVLLYHRVAELELDSQQLAVSPENFRAQLQFLKDHFPVLPLGTDWSQVKEPSVAISFDDGYADNYSNALPVIDDVGLPVTFFVTTGHIGSNREFWWDELERVLLTQSSYPYQFELHDVDGRTLWPTRSECERRKLFSTLQSKMRHLDPDRRDKGLRQLREWVGVNAEGRNTHRALTLHQLKQLSSNRWVTIGAHTVSHTPLSVLCLESQQEEIVAAQKQLAEWLGEPVRLFSYPFGGPKDFTTDTVKIVTDCGYDQAYANYPGQVHRWTAPYRIPRHLVRDWPVDIFSRNLKRFWTYSV